MEIIDSVDDSGAGPSAESMQGVLGFEPSAQCAWIGAADDDPFWLDTILPNQIIIHRIDEEGSIG